MLTDDGKREEGGKRDSKLTYRQKALMDVIRSLDPDQRHTLKIECRGTEPWKLDRVSEQLDADASKDIGQS